MDDSHIYKMKLYPLMPVVFIAAYIFVAFSIAWDKPMTAFTALVVLAAFVVIYFVTNPASRRIKD